MAARVRYCGAMLAALLACVVSFQDAPASGRVTFPALLRDAVQLDWLWQPPKVGERCVQFSSFDPASLKGPKDQDAWYANGDASQYLRVEERDGKKEWVMVDAAGPGAVVRIWSANPKGTLRFYFDLETTPSWSIPFQDLTGGKKEPFVPPLAGVVSAGWNCHVPFPFGKHLKITCTEDGFYYQVNVRCWGPEVEVETFTPKLLESAREELAVPKAWSSRPVFEGARTASRQETVALAAGGTTDVALFEPGESGVLRVLQLEFTPVPGAEAPPLASLLRSTRIVVQLPGGREPVDAPVGDFFGSAPAGLPYRSFVMGVHRREILCMVHCTFPVPLTAGARVLLRSDGPDGGLRVAVSSSTVFEPRDLPKDTLFFHAAWHQARNLKTRPFRDHLVLDASGPGRFVGTTLVVRNPVKAWWGEGDEKFWVDGESFPSTFGTGTEDFFGYAWCSPTLFSHPLHAQPQCDGPGNFGYTCVNRWQLLDSVPFQKSFRFDLEVWHWNPKIEVDYASTAYWYAPLTGTSGLPAMPPVAERLPVAMTPPQPMRVAGALEGEALRVRALTGGKHQTQELDGFGEGRWSGDTQLWWTGGKPGDRLTLEVPVAAAGTYRLTAVFTRAPDYGIVQARLGEQALGAPVDLYAPHVEPSPRVELGEATLPAGVTLLTFELTGRNPASKPGHMLGLDYLLLTAVAGGK